MRALFVYYGRMTADEPGEDTMSATPMWQPSAAQVRDARISAFMRAANLRHGVDLHDYAALYAWSLAARADFWRLLWDYAEVRGDPGDRVLVDGERMPGARWFPQARLNYAENLLRRRDDADALVFRGEDRVHARWSHRALYDEVSRVAQGLRAAGIQAGDRVAAFMPNMPESVIAMLACASIGATWCSCSPDFGVRGVVDRFGQIAPKLLFGVDGYYYNGKTHDCAAEAAGHPGRAAHRRAARRRPLHGAHSRRSTGCATRKRGPTSRHPMRRARSSSPPCPSIIRSTSCSPPAPPACPSASCTAPAARCCSI